GQSEESSKWWRMGKPAFSWRRGARRSLLPHCYASWRIPAWAAPWDLRGGGAWRSASAGRASPKEPSRCIEMPSRNSNKANDGIRRARWKLEECAPRGRHHCSPGLRARAEINSHFGASAGRADARRRDEVDVGHRRGAATTPIRAVWRAILLARKSFVSRKGFFFIPLGASR